MNITGYQIKKRELCLICGEAELAETPGLASVPLAGSIECKGCGVEYDPVYLYGKAPPSTPRPPRGGLRLVTAALAVASVAPIPAAPAAAPRARAVASAQVGRGVGTVRARALNKSERAHVEFIRKCRKLPPLAPDAWRAPARLARIAEVNALTGAALDAEFSKSPAGREWHLTSPAREWAREMEKHARTLREATRPAPNAGELLAAAARGDFTKPEPV